MEKLNKTLKNSEKAITLIALVVTIIVLLILAGVSISMLTGENGILQRATDAKTNTERATVIELAQTDILAQIAENKGENISKEQLATILNKQFKNIDANKIPDIVSTISDLELTTIDNRYKINLSEIYKGKFINNEAPNYSTLLKTYFENESSYDDRHLCWRDNLGVRANDLKFLDNDELYLLYKDSVYKVINQYDDEDHFIGVTVTKLDVTLDLSRFGVQTIDAEFDVLVTPSTPENLIHGEFTRRMYSDENGNEVTGYRTYDKDGNRIFYSASGVIIEEPLS